MTRTNKSYTPAEAVAILSQRGERIANTILDSWVTGGVDINKLRPYVVPEFASSIDEAAIFVHVAPNPKQADSNTHARYSIYRVGMRVADYVDLCILKFSPRSRSAYLSDVLWDCERGFVRLGLEPE